MRRTNFLSFIATCFIVTFSLAYNKGQAEDSGALFLEMERRVGSLEEKIQAMSGRIEELEHALKSGSTAKENLSSSALQKPPSKTPASMMSSASSPNPVNGKRDIEVASLSDTQQKDQHAPLTDQEAYDAARLLLNRGDHDAAESAFKNFIQTHTKSPLVVNAQYWLGETYYSRQDYERSSVAFMEAYKTYRVQVQKGDPAQSFAKAPESLIKLIFSLKGLKKTKNACATYKQLRKEFPELPSNLERLAKRALEGLNCS